jgi:hypothetical protein
MQLIRDIRAAFAEQYRNVKPIEFSSPSYNFRSLPQKSAKN